MEPKTIVASGRVACVIGGWICGQVRKKNRKWANHLWGGAINSAPFLLPEGGRK